MTNGFMEASVAVGLANIALTGLLLATYRRVYQQTKAAFSLALVAFAGAFAVQSLLVVASYLAMMPIIPEPMAPYLFGTGLAEAAGLSAVVWTALH